MRETWKNETITQKEKTEHLNRNQNEPTSQNEQWVGHKDRQDSIRQTFLKELYRININNI